MTVNQYATVTPTSSQAVNLLNYAASFDSFRSSDYVIFCDAEYSYYIVWGDLDHEGDTVISSGDTVEYIHYYRTSTSGYTSSYTYNYGSDDSLLLNLSSEYIGTTSIEGVGFVSSTYETMKFQDSVSMLFVFMAAMIFAIMIKAFGRFQT